MIDLTFGRPGECKSLDQAKTVLWLLNRALKIKKKYGLHREVWTNFHLRKDFYEIYKGHLFYYNDLFQLIDKKDIDIVIDEVAVYLPCDRWKDTHFEIRRMLAQHRKRGLEIYANTQDYKMVDINFRRMIRYVYIVKKLFGSRDPSASLPPVKFIWGMYLRREVDVASLEEGKELSIGLFPSFKFITRYFCELYDTREDIKGTGPAPYHHVMRNCEIPECGFKKINHI